MDQTWEKLLQTIVKASKINLQHYDRNSDIGIFTDASEKTWSVIIGLCSFDDNLPFSVETCEFKPMLFNSGKFANHEKNWSMTQKELYPMLQSFERFKYLLEGHIGKIHHFTDHKNLLPILRPTWT